MFSTALAPFISDFLFRYDLTDKFGSGAGVSLVGVVWAIIFGLASGFLVPAILPGTTAMHRGYNMYKAGLALGMLGIFIYCFLYKTFGIQPHSLYISTIERTISVCTSG